MNLAHLSNINMDIQKLDDTTNPNISVAPNNVENIEKPKKNFLNINGWNKRFLKITFFFVVLIILLALAALLASVIYRYGLSYLKKDEIVEESTESTGSKDGENAVNENIESSSDQPPLRDGGGIHLNEPAYPYKENNGEPMNNMSGVVNIPDPVISRSGEYNIYSYVINLNESFSIAHKEGLKYEINSLNCVDRTIEDSASKFVGTVVSPKYGDNNIFIKIDRRFLSAQSLAASTFIIRDMTGNEVYRGSVSVPLCKEIVTDYYGEMSLSLGDPVISKSDKEGFTRFTYELKHSADMLVILEKGFSLKIMHDCSGWLVGTDPFVKTWSSGKLGYLGFTADIDDDALIKTNPVKSSVYTVTTVDEKYPRNYQGFVNVPNCK